MICLRSSNKSNTCTLMCTFMHMCKCTMQFKYKCRFECLCIYAVPGCIASKSRYSLYNATIYIMHLISHLFCMKVYGFLQMSTSYIMCLYRVLFCALKKIYILYKKQIFIGISVENIPLSVDKQNYTILKVF